MSKLNSDNLNFKNDDFVVELEDDVNFIEGKRLSKRELLLNRAQNSVQQAQLEAQQILDKAQLEANEKAAEIIAKANSEAANIIEKANLEIQNQKETSQKEIDDLMISSNEQIEKAKTEAAKTGYDEGYQDANQKLLEEMEEKIRLLDNFCIQENIIKDKILKNVSRDIINIISNISKKVIFKELDANSLDKIIKRTISMFEKKENIKIIVSEKYAKLLYAIEKQNLSDEIEFNFNEFKQYQGFEIVFKPDFDDDTIIIENLQERFDASIKQQLDVIIREIEENSKSDFELEEYQENETE